MRYQAIMPMALNGVTATKCCTCKKKAHSRSGLKSILLEELWRRHTEYATLFVQRTTTI